MPKFMLLYRGPATPPEAMSPEERDRNMAAYMAWLERVGSGVVDMGLPMVGERSLDDRGGVSAPAHLNGYTVVQADDMDGAMKFVEGHPFLADKSGRFNVDVYEMMTMPGSGG